MGFVESFVGLLIWTVANVAYGLFRTSGEGGFKRIVAFWMGMPLTWITLIVVREGVPMLASDADDVGGEIAELRADIDRDRRLRGGGGEPGRGPGREPATDGLPDPGDAADSGDRSDPRDEWRPLSR